MSPVKKNQNEVETEKYSNDSPHQPHVVQMEIDEEPTATFKSIKRMVINWMFRALGIAAVFGAGVVYRHEVTLNAISQTVGDMSISLQEIQNDQRENNKLLIQLLRDRRGP